MLRNSKTVSSYKARERRLGRDLTPYGNTISFTFQKKQAKINGESVSITLSNYVSQLIERLEWNIKINTLSFDTPLKEDQLVW